MSELTVGALSGLASNSYVIDVASGSTLDLSAGAVFPAGSIIQVVSATKLDTFSTTSTSLVDVTGLSVSITPSSTSSKVMIFADVHAGFSASDYVLFSFVRNSTLIAQGTSGSAKNDTMMTRPSSADFLNHTGMNFLDSPSTTSATTYKIQMAVFGGTGFVNRRGADAQLNAASSITVMEVAG